MSKPVYELLETEQAINTTWECNAGAEYKQLALFHSKEGAKRAIDKVIKDRIEEYLKRVSESDRSDEINADYYVSLMKRNRIEIYDDNGYDGEQSQEHVWFCIKKIPVLP